MSKKPNKKTQANKEEAKINQRKSEDRDIIVKVSESESNRSILIKSNQDLLQVILSSSQGLFKELKLLTSDDYKRLMTKSIDSNIKVDKSVIFPP